MNIRKGLCVGGPYDGEMFASHHNPVPFYKPGLEFSLTKPVENLRVEAVPVGKYVWSGTPHDVTTPSGNVTETKIPVWQWEPT